LKPKSVPLPIPGFPLPPSLKDYVTLDALAVSIKGGTGVELTGGYNGCSGITQWDGSGVLSATVKIKEIIPGDALVSRGH